MTPIDVGSPQARISGTEVAACCLLWLSMIFCGPALAEQWFIQLNGIDLVRNSIVQSDTSLTVEQGDKMLVRTYWELAEDLPDDLVQISGLFSTEHFIPLPHVNIPFEALHQGEVTTTSLQFTVPREALCTEYFVSLGLVSDNLDRFERKKREESLRDRVPLVRLRVQPKAHPERLSEDLLAEFREKDATSLGMFTALSHGASKRIPLPDSPRIRELILVQYLVDSQETAQGARVGTVSLLDGEKALKTFQMKAGIELADAYHHQATAHKQPKVWKRLKLPEALPGKYPERFLHLSRFPLDQPLPVDSITFDHAGNAHQWIIEGAFFYAESPVVPTPEEASEVETAVGQTP